MPVFREECGFKDRGPYGVRLFISDTHEDLKAARNAVFPAVSWQRCQFYLLHNAQKYVPWQIMKKEVEEELYSIFTAPSEEGVLRLLVHFLNDYRKNVSGLASWVKTTGPKALQ